MNKDLLNFIETSELPTDIANFKVHAFTELENNKDHLAISFGNLTKKPSILARIHSQCITGESFFSMRCDCRFQLTESLKQITSNGSGVIFYLQQEGRGIGLSNKIRAYKLQDQGLDTVEANHQLGFDEDERNYEIVVSMAKHLNIRSLDLMTNNPKKINALEKMGLIINKRVPILSKSNEYNKRYLSTKARKLGHLM
jgi:GTP cyclohydrolase II